MRLILSRKGFDSSSGGCPSPILPDGSLVSLPIPDEASAIRYGNIRARGTSLGALVRDLTRGRVTPDDTAHLDPDLRAACYPRQPGWRPLFGQSGAAQGHLRGQGVCPGDIFLFFGLFREAEFHQGRWRYVPGTRPRHVLWGWLQAGEILAVDSLPRREIPWAAYHPHMSRHEADNSNTLYVASDELEMDGRKPGLPGAGLFNRYRAQLQLTGKEASSPTSWRLPRWFHPRHRRSVLSYHRDPSRWIMEADGCGLRSASRGQEFVLDTRHYPETTEWLEDLLGSDGVRERN